MTILSEPDCGLIKIVAVFNVGRDVETKKGLAQSVSSMLKKETRTKGNKMLQSAIDRIGASIEIYTSPLFFTAELYCLKPFFQEGFDLFFEILFEAKFKSKDWKIVQKIAMENILQNEFQTDFWADKLLSETILGSESPLGYYSSSSDYESILLNDIESYYHKYIASNSPEWFLAGEISDIEKNYIKDKERGYSLSLLNRSFDTTHYNQASIIKKRIPDSTQASIRIGVVIPRKDFEDFLAIEIFNTFLGGYYLSALMRTLRIEKGYTYGVYSHALHLPGCTLVSISYESDKQHIEESLLAIKELFSRLNSKKTIDFREAKEQYYGMWSKQSEKSLQEIMYEIKLKKLGYCYTDYKNRIKDLKSITPNNIEKYRPTLLNFERYTQAIVF